MSRRRRNQLWQNLEEVCLELGLVCVLCVCVCVGGGGVLSLSFCKSVCLSVFLSLCLSVSQYTVTGVTTEK